MASPIQCIIEGALLTGAAAELFTAGAGEYVQIVKVTANNTDTVSHQLTIYLVQAGAAAGAVNITTNAQALLGGQTYNSPNEYAQVLNPGDSIWAFADTAGKVNLRVSALLAT